MRRFSGHSGAVVDAHTLTARQRYGTLNSYCGQAGVERGYDAAAGAGLPGIHAGTCRQRQGERGRDGRPPRGAQQAATGARGHSPMVLRSGPAVDRRRLIGHRPLRMPTREAFAALGAKLGALDLAVGIGARRHEPANAVNAVGTMWALSGSAQRCSPGLRAWQADSWTADVTSAISNATKAGCERPCRSLQVAGIAR